MNGDGRYVVHVLRVVISMGEDREGVVDWIVHSQAIA